MINFFEKAEGFLWNKYNTDKISEKHNVSPIECEEAFFNEMFIEPDETHSVFEQRYKALGVTESSRLLFVVFTIRNNKIRVISARPMSKRERRVYDEKIKAATKI